MRIAYPPPPSRTRVHSTVPSCPLNRPLVSIQTSQRFWSVVFTGEGAEDVGGPFREHLTEMCNELMSDALPLFLPTPNHRSNIGNYRDCWLPRPSLTSPLHISMYTFIGMLMGGAIRSSEPLGLYLPPVVWKGMRLPANLCPTALALMPSAWDVVNLHNTLGADLPPASASSDMIRWSRVLLSHTLDVARSH